MGFSIELLKNNLFSPIFKHQINMRKAYIIWKSVKT